jgi:CRISPR/Cas system CSM-associated protein Csm4 (group 5 of RAMP superfamily)
MQNEKSKSKRRAQRANQEKREEWVKNKKNEKSESRRRTKGMEQEKTERKACIWKNNAWRWKRIDQAREVQWINKKKNESSSAFWFVLDLG